MSTYMEMDYTRSHQRIIEWNETRTKAAYLLARGHTKTHTAEQVGVTRATIYNWLDDPEFHMEVDRLTLMIDVASRAGRMRETYRVLRAKRQADGSLQSDKDSLDWLKFAQSETDGVKLDLSKLLQLDDTGDSGRLPSQSSPAIDVGPLAQSSMLGPSQDTVSDSDASQTLATDDLDHVGHS